MRSVYLLTAGIALAAVLNFLSVTSKSGHFKSTGSQNSERKARDTRPFKFRVLQALSSHSQTLGWWLRECMYVRMKDDFKDNGLRISDLNYAAAWFTKPNTVSKDGIQKVIPKMIPPQNADRYVVLPIGNGAFERKRSFPAKNAEEIRSKLESVAKDALNLLSLHVNPKKYFYFAPRSDAYHVTLFHTSALEDPRPLPVADLQKEVQTIAQFAKQNEEPIILTLRDIILARSGTLLAAWNVEAGGANIERVRADIWKKFPYAPSGQTQRILHTSLLRLICFEKCRKPIFMYLFRRFYI
ncbi:hypothetical protein AAMO2058_000965700 [Amorphochlora amoebiformis]